MLHLYTSNQEASTGWTLQAWNKWHQNTKLVYYFVII